MNIFALCQNLTLSVNFYVVFSNLVIFKEDTIKAIIMQRFIITVLIYDQFLYLYICIDIYKFHVFKRL